MHKICGRFFALSTLVLFVFSALAKAQFSAADFLPPVQGGPTEISQPENVSVSDDMIEAATAQDGFNVATNAHNDEAPEPGLTVVRFSSGIGIVATGMGSYVANMSNPVAVRLSKRKAYVRAFMEAKKELAANLNGLSNEAQDSIVENMEGMELPDGGQYNMSSSSTEAIKQSTEMLLKGFVIYSVKDMPEDDTVYVSIVTTPKTRSQTARIGGTVVESANLIEALQTVLNEVQSGVVPPVGGRIISAPLNGEAAYIGYGSAVVRVSKNRTMQSRLKQTAKRQAQMRAADALCGLIVGDETKWEGSFSEGESQEIKEFEFDDPTAGLTPENTQKLEETRQSFVNTLSQTDVFSSARSGKLPPGIAPKTWFDEDHAWAYAMYVYMPSMGALAKRSAAEMKQGGKSGGGDGQSGFTQSEKPIKRPGQEVKKGPSGTFGVD